MSNVKKNLNFSSDDEETKDNEVTQLKSQLKALTEKLEKLEGVSSSPVYGFAKVSTPLKHAVSREHMSVYDLNSSKVEAEQFKVNEFPDTKFLKLIKISTFSGEAEYPELGPNFAKWRVKFIQELRLAQGLSGLQWSEDIKLIILERFLGGPVLTFFEAHKTSWTCDCDQVLNALQTAFTRRITGSEGTTLLRKQKSKDRSWDDHWVYMIAVASRMPPGDYGYTLVETLVLHSSSELKSQFLNKYDPSRVDYPQHASEILEFAKLLDADSGKSTQVKKHPVNNVSDRLCFKCGKPGHIARNCRSQVGSVDNVFNVNEVVQKDVGDHIARNHRSQVGSVGPKIKWILDSGAAIHLTNMKNILSLEKHVDKSVCVADQRELKLSSVGQVKMSSWAGNKVIVNNVYYHPSVKNLLSLGLLESKGCILTRQGNQK